MTKTFFFFFVDQAVCGKTTSLILKQKNFVLVLNIILVTIKTINARNEPYSIYEVFF